MTKLFDTSIVGNSESAVDSLPTSCRHRRNIPSSARISTERSYCGMKVPAASMDTSPTKSSASAAPLSSRYRSSWPF
jgi:hypothetical protein